MAAWTASPSSGRTARTVTRRPSQLHIDGEEFRSWCDSRHRHFEWLPTRSILLGNELVLISRLAITARFLPLGQLYFLARRLLVRNPAQEVGDEIEARAPLVVRPHHVPRRPFRIRRLEHLIAGARVVVPGAGRLEVHRR